MACPRSHSHWTGYKVWGNSVQNEMQGSRLKNYQKQQDGNNGGLNHASGPLACGTLYGYECTSTWRCLCPRSRSQRAGVGPQSGSPLKHLPSLTPSSFHTQGTPKSLLGLSPEPICRCIVIGDRRRLQLKADSQFLGAGRGQGELVPQRMCDATHSWAPRHTRSTDPHSED